ncbi:MAG TPA: hypothetical protein DHV28_17650 [Ignavibacteriales bacterium]|nr:hypothetical protein [Ignavibacteriales bacterium]
MNEAAYQELKKMFYETPEWIHKKQVRELGFFAYLHYRFFLFVMSFRIRLLERRLRIVKINLDIQQRAYILMSCKILYTEKFLNSLKKL